MCGCVSVGVGVGKRVHLCECENAFVCGCESGCACAGVRRMGEGVHGCVSVHDIFKAQKAM